MRDLLGELDASVSLDHMYRSGRQLDSASSYSVSASQLAAQCSKAMQLGKAVDPSVVAASHLSLQYTRCLAICCHALPSRYA